MYDNEEAICAFINIVILIVITFFASLNILYVTNTEIIKASKVCSDINSEISILYADGDFECRNGASFDRSVLKWFPLL